MMAIILNPRRLLSTAFLLAVFLHLLGAVIFSFTIHTKMPGQKPLVTFLGSILSARDLIMTDKPIESRPAHKPIISAEFIKSQDSPKNISATEKPIFASKLSTGRKSQFKPPKELFISQSDVVEDQNREPPDIILPPREPLKLDTHDSN